MKSVHRRRYDGAAVYRMRDADGRLLYVGVTAGRERFDQHRLTALWFGDVATIEVTHFQTRAEASAAELSAIGSEHPMYNIDGREAHREAMRSA